MSPKPFPLWNREDSVEVGAELGPLVPQATTSIVWLSALDTRQVLPLPVSSPGIRLPITILEAESVHKCWTFIITWSVRLHFFCSICTCHKFQKVTLFPSISDFDDQVVCFIHAVHHWLCVFKNLNISYILSNMYYVSRTMLEYPPPLRILTATFEVPCGPKEK